jgi:Acetyltransferase (GNAT) domain
MTTHPGGREADVVLRNGSTVHVCPAKPADAPAVRLLLRGLSDRSRWLRFFSACPDLAKAARWATEVDNDRRFGLVATVERDGRVVGHAGLERESDRPERAEVALEVADAMQGKGWARRCCVSLPRPPTSSWTPRCWLRTARCSGCFVTAATPSRSTASLGWSWSSSKSARPHSPEVRSRIARWHD